SLLSPRRAHFVRSKTDGAGHSFYSQLFGNQTGIRVVVRCTDVRTAGPNLLRNILPDEGCANQIATGVQSRRCTKGDDDFSALPGAKSKIQMSDLSIAPHVRH